MRKGTYIDKDSRVVHVYAAADGGYILKYPDNGQVTIIR